MKLKLIKDLILTKHKSIGDFFTKNKDNSITPTRDQLYRLVDMDIRDVKIKHLLAVLELLGYQDKLSAIMIEVQAGEQYVTRNK